MLKTTHFDEEKCDFKPTTARYFHDKKLLLEVEDAAMSHVAGEYVVISGKTYLVAKIVSYPELLIEEYHTCETE